MEQLEVKETTCHCGHVNIITRKTDWCEKCGHKIYYTEKDKKAHKYSVLYAYVLLFGVIGFLSYVFVELLLVPSLNL